MAEKTLVFISGKYEGGSYTLPEQGTITIGRGGELDIVVVEDMVSRRHAEIRVEGEQVVYQDLGSTNGSFLNGERFSKATLKHGDRLALGSSILEYRSPETGLQEAPKMPEPSIPPRLDFSDAPPSELSDRSEDDFAEQSFVDAPSDLSIMSLPDEDNLSSLDGDIDIAPPVEIPENGTIEEETIRETIELLGTARFSGVLKIDSDDETHAVSFKNGQLIDVQHGEYEGLDPRKALSRLLPIDEGVFTIEKNDSISGQAIEADTDKLLGATVYQLQEFESLMNKLPAPEDKLIVCRPIPGQLRSLHEDELDIFQLVFNVGFFQLVLDRSTSSDLATARTVERLLENGYIKV